MRLLKRIFVILVILTAIVLGVFFSVQNSTKVPVDLLIVQLTDQYLAFWLLAAFALGGLFGLMVSMITMAKMKKREMSLRREISRYEKTMAKQQLTTQP